MDQLCSTDIHLVLRHAAYRENHPWLSAGRDLLGELVRPSRLVMATFVLATAAHFGAPVERAIPQPVKQAYADGRAWQTKNAARLGCAEHHSAAMRSESPREIERAEVRCAELERTYGH